MREGDNPALSIAASNLGATEIEQGVAVMAGKTYELTALLKQKNFSGEAYLDLDFRNAANGKLIGTKSVRINGGGIALKTSTLEVTAVAPSNATTVNVTLFVGKSAKGTVLFDDVMLAEK